MPQINRPLLSKLTGLLGAAKWVDLAPMLENDMPRWPTHPPVVIHQTVTHKHDGYYCQTLFTPEHAGAHVDSPYHIYENLSEQTIETFPVNVISGPCKVIQMEGLKPGELGTAEYLIKWERETGEKIESGDIVLINFGWIDSFWRTDQQWDWYALNSPGLDETVADLLLERGIKALGTDTIACGSALKDGVRTPGPPPPNHCWIHNKLLPRQVLLMECIANMKALPDACYFLALPLKIRNGSGSPIRPVGLVF
jgi:arylformamidase